MPKTPNSLTSTKDKNGPIKKKPGFSRLLLIVSVLVFALAGYLLSLPKVQRDDFTLNVVHKMRLPELVESIQERMEWAIQKHLSEADGSRDFLPDPADKPKQYGLGIKRSEPQNY